MLRYLGSSPDRKGLLPKTDSSFNEAQIRPQYDGLMVPGQTGLGCWSGTLHPPHLCVGRCSLPTNFFGVPKYSSTPYSLSFIGRDGYPDYSRSATGTFLGLKFRIRWVCI